ncbi:hypothetical protein Glove_207g34 [Diversispora epigaea]|uniref:Uncharacterized protein n=1 Tax=Diversispora epigaea TaxID=1348612 RepID=A0A397IJI7_9GLOM|nr:hypothetical protein Glove_207g34 [Diversispora epigaea]
MMIDSLESENLLNNENNFESIHENSNEDEGEGKNEDEDNDSYNAEVEEESLTSDISHSSVSFFENMELSNSEPENYSFNNYASDYNNICEKAEPIEFPNNAYADLMALVTNYNLSNEATNAVIRFFNEHSNFPLSPLSKNTKKRRELMEKMKIPTLTSKKHKILTHNNIDYYLFYHPVLNCIKNILSISDISQNFTLRFENFKYKGEKAYSEQYTGNWWKNTEASLLHGSNLLSIILYSDATTTDTLEYFYNNTGQDVSLENIPNYFWSLPSINVYSATVPDRMHHLDLGLFHYQIEFTQALLQKQDSSLVNKIDNRLSKIS